MLRSLQRRPYWDTAADRWVRGSLGQSCTMACAVRGGKCNAIKMRSAVESFLAAPASLREISSVLGVECEAASPQSCDTCDSLPSIISNGNGAYTCSHVPQKDVYGQTTCEARPNME